MARQIPACPPAPIDRVTGQIESLQVTLTTPMFGGGFTPGVPDRTMPFRASSIRGQLRFWWRATRGSNFTNIHELFEAEASIWGSTERPSEVTVRLGTVHWGAEAPRQCAQWLPKIDDPTRFRLEWDSLFSKEFQGFPSALPYFAFPFQGENPSQRRAKPPASYVPPGVSFELEIAYPNRCTADVKTALAAWLNLGGIGARTRRGFGSLYCPAYAWNESDLNPIRLDHKLGGYPTSERREWPTLSRLMHYRAGPDPTLDCWRLLADNYRYFRQGLDFARNGTHKKPGRSLWPEPESIRQATGQRLPKHQRNARIPDNAVPRAALGLPINTTFHPQQSGRTARDDPRRTLWAPIQGERVRDRWASPLILKPLAVSKDKSLPLALVLNGPPIQDVALVDAEQKDANGNPQVLTVLSGAAIRDPSLARYPDSPLAGAPQTGDAIDAFLALFQESCERDARKVFP